MDKTLILHEGEYKKLNEGTPEKPEGISTTSAIPIMTSNTTPSGIASASDETYPAYKAFDGNVAEQGWVAFSTIGWLKYQFENKITISKYELVFIGSNQTDMSSRMPKDWTFEGSNDGANWTVLDTQKGVTWSNVLGTQVKSYNINSKNDFSYYRINITKNNGNAKFLEIDELRIFEYLPSKPAIPPSWQTVSSTLPSSTQFIEQGMDSLTPILDRKITTLEPMSMADKSEILLEGEGQVFGSNIDLKKYFDIRNIKVDPDGNTDAILMNVNNTIYSLNSTSTTHAIKMTSNTAPAPFVASASSVYSATYPAWRAFDGVYNVSGTNATAWISANNTTTGDVTLNFGVNTKVSKVSMAPRNFVTDGVYNAPKDFIVQGSNDGVTYFNLKEFKNQTHWTLGQLTEFDLQGIFEYRYYRIKINAITGGGTVNYIAIGQIVYGYDENILLEVPTTNEKNFVQYGMDEVMHFNGIINNKKYVLQDTVSEIEQGLWTTQLERKPLSIKFD